MRQTSLLASQDTYSLTHCVQRVNAVLVLSPGLLLQVLLVLVVALVFFCVLVSTASPEGFHVAGASGGSCTTSAVGPITRKRGALEAVDCPHPAPILLSRTTHDCWPPRELMFPENLTIGLRFL